MRTASIFTAAVAIAAAITLALPPQDALAGGLPPLIGFLAKKAGTGMPDATQNGYNSYLLNRFTRGKSPDATLVGCQSDCQRWYGKPPQWHNLRNRMQIPEW